MKKIMLIVGALALTTAAIAQDKKTYKTKFGGVGKRVVLAIVAKSISVEGYDGDEVIIEAENVPQIPKEAEGLRAMGTGGLDNTQIGLSVNITDNSLNINTVQKGEATYKLRIPRELGLQTKGTNECYCNEDLPLRIQGLAGDIEVKSNQRDLEIIDVTGPIVANSQQGKIKIVFSEKMPEKISSIVASGESIDITVSEKANVLFAVAVREGSFFTDVDLKPYSPPAKETQTTNRIDGSAKVAVKEPSASLAQMQTSVAQAQVNTKGYAFVEAYKNDSWFNNSNFSKYLLNEPKTVISIQTTHGNIYLRKSNDQKKK